MDNDNINEVPKSQEEIVFEEMSQGLDQIRQQRNALLQQLTEVVGTTKINFEEDAPRKTEMKLTLFKTVDDLLKSQESLLTTKTKLSIQKKSEASSDALKQMAVEVLRKIEMGKKGSSVPVSIDPTDNDTLRQAFNKLTKEDPDKAIKDDELVMEEPTQK